MAGGWSRDGAVQDQIDASVDDAVRAARERLPRGTSAERCAACDEPIPQARRLAVPGVMHCVACQSVIDEERARGGLDRARQQGQPAALNVADIEWVFGYGSLLWRPGFVPVASHRASAADRARRFWQASHDHRGTPGSPGRVVTLVPMPGERCDALVHRLPVAGRARILAMLDHRERDGYLRTVLPVTITDAAVPRLVTAITWVADPRHPSWVGPAGDAALPATLSHAVGDSGSNRDYLLELARALSGLDIEDPYITDLTRQLREYDRSMV